MELTLKHVKALTTLLENQQQKILALQNGMQIGEKKHTHTHTHNKMILQKGIQISEFKYRLSSLALTSFHLDADNILTNSQMQHSAFLIYCIIITCYRNKKLRQNNSYV